ncbi:hypothetical protein BC829DRAFT_32262 [Chytridium lagenaria]|nr:hypothetical protein BC829DRAFT_32262 [Chytridium lagenaria]
METTQTDAPPYSVQAAPIASSAGSMNSESQRNVPENMDSTHPYSGIIDVQAGPIASSAGSMNSESQLSVPENMDSAHPYSGIIDVQAGPIASSAGSMNSESQLSVPENMDSTHPYSGIIDVQAGPIASSAGSMNSESQLSVPENMDFAIASLAEFVVENGLQSLAIPLGDETVRKSKRALEKTKREKRTRKSPPKTKTKTPVKLHQDIGTSSMNNADSETLLTLMSGTSFNGLDVMSNDVGEMPTLATKADVAKLPQLTPIAPGLTSNEIMPLISGIPLDASMNGNIMGEMTPNRRQLTQAIENFMSSIPIAPEFAYSEALPKMGPGSPFNGSFLEMNTDVGGMMPTQTQLQAIIGNFHPSTPIVPTSADLSTNTASPFNSALLLFDTPLEQMPLFDMPLDQMPLFDTPQEQVKWTPMIPMTYPLHQEQQKYRNW